MAYCGPTQLRSQAARPNRSNHPPLRVVILVTAVVHGKTKKKEIPRLEIAGEDGDGRSRCVFWRGAAEAAADLVKIGAVVSCVVQRSDCDGAVVVCEGCRDLRVEWKAGDAPHAKAVVRRVAGAARPAKRLRRAPAGSYGAPVPLGAAVQSPKSVWTRASIHVAQPRIGRGEPDQAVGRLLELCARLARRHLRLRFQSKCATRESAAPYASAASGWYSTNSRTCGLSSPISTTCMLWKQTTATSSSTCATMASQSSSGRQKGRQLK